MDDVPSKDLILLLEKQENCDIIFKLNGNVDVKAHSYILSTLSAKFYYESNAAFIKVIIMDIRIKERAMWNFLRYMYGRKKFHIDFQLRDSYILLAYYFDVQELITYVDKYLMKQLNCLTAVRCFWYTIDMNMSYNVKEKIYDFITRNVITLPRVFTLDMVLMQPNILRVAQTAYDNYMRNVSTGPEDLPPILEINAELVGIKLGSGQARIILHEVTAICHEEVNIENDIYSDADDFIKNAGESQPYSEEVNSNVDSEEQLKSQKDVKLKPQVVEQLETQFELELEPHFKEQLKPIENEKYLDTKYEKIYLQQFDKDFKAYDSDELSETEISLCDLYDCPVYKTAKQQKSIVEELKSFLDQY